MCQGVGRGEAVGGGSGLVDQAVVCPLAELGVEDAVGTGVPDDLGDLPGVPWTGGLGAQECEDRLCAGRAYFVRCCGGAVAGLAGSALCGTGGVGSSISASMVRTWVLATGRVVSLSMR